MDYPQYIWILGSLLGSVKGALASDERKSFILILVDVSIGTFTGYFLAEHFGSTSSTALSGLMALLGGSVGGALIDSAIELSPNIFKTYLIKNYLNKNK